MRYFIATGFDWEQGKIIDTETFREGPHKNFFLDEVPEHLNTTDDYLARRKAEVRFEKIRFERYPNKPSRKMALFLNASVEDALHWTSKPQRQDYRIFELSVVAQLSSAEANYIWFNYCVRLCLDPATEFRRIFSSDLDSEVDRVAHAYWKNESTEPYDEASRLETLFIGTLSVVKCVS